MKAVVVIKEAKLDVLQQDNPDGLEHLRRSDERAWRQLVTSEQVQRASRDEVGRALDAADIDVEFVDREAFDGPGDADLVVCVGGDGTVLDVSHRVVDVPILAVNGDPDRSVGYFCATDAFGLGRVLAEWVADEASVSVLRRIVLDIDGARLPFPCMNDILVANRNPAMMSRYVLTAGRREEQQASSGLWISTPAGSTAGIRSAGGTVMPLEGALVQYLVREPFLGRSRRYELLRGVRHLSEGLRIRSLMDNGAIYVDGPWNVVPFEIGSELALSEGPPVRIVGMDPLLRER